MTNKEILAELTISYRYLKDIRENGCIDHCTGQIDNSNNKIDKLDRAISDIEDVYDNFYKTLDKKELKINKEVLDNELYISSCIDSGYDVYEKNGNPDFIDCISCEDICYHWYYDKNYLDM